MLATVTLSETEIAVAETDGDVDVTLRRTGDLTATSTVALTAAGTATPGADYVDGAPYVVSFAPNQAEETLTLSVLDDAVDEGTEVVDLTITDAGTDIIGDGDRTRVRILDDEAPSAPAAVALGVVDAAVRETDGTVSVPIVRTGDLTGTTTVNIASVGDAIANVDYTYDNPYVVTFAPGESRKDLVVPILDDGLAEGTEIFSLELLGAEGADLAAPRTAQVRILDDEAPSGPGASDPAAAELDFTNEIVVPQIFSPTSFKWFPDDPSRILVLRKAGIIEIWDVDDGADGGAVKVGQLWDLRDEINGRGDRGLLDVEFHPDFGPENPWIYLYYTVDPTENADGTPGGVFDNPEGANDGPDGAGSRYLHLARVQLDPATGYQTVREDTREILVGGAGQSLDDLVNGGASDYSPDEQFTDPIAYPPSDLDANGQPKQDIIVMDSLSHGGGDITFYDDPVEGLVLYLSTGDGSAFNYADPRATRVQSLDNLSGKILRVDPDTGEGLASNPFATDDLAENRSKVFQYGLRNPFRTRLDEETGDLYIGDVGWFTYEELNVGEPGANFGWPYKEGGRAGSLWNTPNYELFGDDLIVYSDVPDADAFYRGLANGGEDVTSPRAAFHHLTEFPGFQMNAVILGDFLDGAVYPELLDGTLVMMDVAQGRILGLNVEDPEAEPQLLAEDPALTGIVFMEKGPDGYIYYGNIFENTLGRFRFEIADTVGNDVRPLRLAFGNAFVDGFLGALDTTLEGDDGDDTIEGTAVSEEIVGGDGDDFLRGNDGEDLLRGGTGDDRLEGKRFDDILIGGDGNDRLYGALDVDVYVGGAGFDRLYVAATDAIDTIVVTHRGAADLDIAHGYHQDFDVIDLQPLLEAYDPATDDINDFVQLVVRNDARAELWVDPVGTGAYEEALRLFGTIGALGDVDQMIGDDRLVVDASGSVPPGSSPGGVTDALAPGRLVLGQAAVDDRLIAVKAPIDDAEDNAGTLDGSALPEAIRAGDEDDVVNAGAGDDVVWGDSGDDRLVGNADDDILLGGAGSDQLFGNLGNDVYIGGPGKDSLYGGSEGGADLFIIDGSGNNNRDNLYFFEYGTDLIDMQPLLGAYDPATDNIDDFVEARYVTDPVTRLELWLDPDGGGDFTRETVRLRTVLGDVDLATLTVDQMITDGALRVSAPAAPVGELATARGVLGVDVVDRFLISLTNRIVGDDNANSLLGTTAPELVQGLGGDDILSADDNGDLLSGGEGADTLNGDDGDDLLLGGIGADVLRGGLGIDAYIGGAGADRLIGDADGTLDRFLVDGFGADADVIEGFEYGTDVLNVHPLLDAYDPATDNINDFLATNYVAGDDPRLELLVDVAGGGNFADEAVRLLGEQGPRTIDQMITDEALQLQPVGAESVAPKRIAIDVDFDDATGIALNGAAGLVDGAVRLTGTADTGAVGSVFAVTPSLVDPDTSFATDFTLAFGGGPDGGEGMAFVAHNLPETTGALGAVGGRLGLGPDFIGSLAVVFDNADDGNGDDGPNRVRIVMDGEVDKELAAAPAPVDLDATADPRHVWIDYDGATDLMEVFVATGPTKPADALVQAEVRLNDVVGDRSYFGFTASTSDVTADHDLLDWQLVSGEDVFVG